MQIGLVTNAASATGSAASVPQPRLVRAAHEFEGMMMKELLKPMTGSDGESDSMTGGDGAGSMGVLGDFATEALGQALSQRGGMGIANSILHSLSHSGTSGAGDAHGGKVTGKITSDTVMSNSK
jgi:Rod binding domain-containing protein